MYQYEFSPEGKRQLRALPQEIQRLIIKKLDYVITSDTPLSLAKRLIHYSAGQYRYRMGDYRIVFDVKEQMIVVLGVGHRREIYK